ncbi:bifunctional phosphopantothenoylcysteine decarboxylase/phosphopantothenate--cysteine ligase CoaBC [Calothrix sp. 336/3]|uniref:bifunctional phosphopantothenoylcysteine decarboxylase/phosphopantothenate--cysteine ligase CoaBC n=1 Tax=Calothrix sp. 336/3 TaxID=1337936 RepID=UPI000A678396|nr:bifunctional phosphopantothenoylcysteine decarboxylase/phosphopantothenate--cysteine ligase CoaBC [Calothrix sp. 336/3]
MNQRVLIGVGGGIAAYKICEVVSTLFKSGVEVQVILTNSAEKFISPLTFATLSRHQAYTDDNFWQPIYSRPLHIELGEWADIFLIAPLTANTLAKLTHGIADNLLTNTILASTCPVLLAPAMNTDMWEQQTVQKNWQMLLTDGRYHGMDTASGLLACDRVGAGRMAEPWEITAYVQSLLHTRGQRDLAGKKVLISTGATREHFDPVRFIGNPATGKMGLALAQAAKHRGAEVTLVYGVAHWNLPLGVRGIPVVTSAEMRGAMMAELHNHDVIIMSAAVADVKPQNYNQEKLPKAALPSTLALEPVGDIIAEISQHRQPQQKLIGFAAQTGDIITPAKEKLQRKKLDVIVANPVDKPNSGFASDRNQAVFLDYQGRQQEIPDCTKLQLAHYLFDFIRVGD